LDFHRPFSRWKFLSRSFLYIHFFGRSLRYSVGSCPEAEFDRSSVWTASSRRRWGAGATASASWGSLAQWREGRNARFPERVVLGFLGRESAFDELVVVLHVLWI
jgi:hypothetical protein